MGSCKTKFREKEQNGNLILVFGEKYLQNEVLFSFFRANELCCSLLRKNNGGFCFRRKIAKAGFQFLKKNTILLVGQESPDRTKLKRAVSVSNLKA